MLLVLSLILLTVSPILVWLNTPREGIFKVVLSGVKAFVTMGWWLFLGTFIYYYFNFFLTHLVLVDEKLLVSILFFLGCSPVLFWLGRSNQIVLSKILICFKAVLSFVWIAFLAILVYVNFIFSPLDLVQDQIVSQQDSPDSAYAVAVVNRFGGATVSNNTLVVIRPKGESIDTKHDQVLFQMDGIKKVNLTWIGTNQLTIQHEDGEVYKQLPTWQNVVITYANQ